MGESAKAPGRVTEFFWLAGAAQTAARLSEDDRVRLHRHLAVGRQRAEAAEALWSNGHSAEGLRLAKQAFMATLAMVGPFGSALRAAPEAPKAAAAPEEKAKEVAPGPADLADEDRTAPEADAPEEAPAEAEEGEAEAAEATAKAEVQEPAGAPRAHAPADEPEPAAEPGTEPETAEEPETAADAGSAEPDHAEAATEAKSDRPDPGYREVLAARGLRKGRLDDLAAVQRELDEAVLPEWDEDVTPGHGDLFQRVVSARRHVDASVAPALMSTREIGWARFSRVGGAVAVVLAASIGSYLALRTPEGVHVTASGQWAPDSGGPEWAIDGNPNTEWQTPTRQAGWIEITIEPPRRIDRLRILNGHNRQYNDRAVRDAAIEIYADGDLARTIDQSWPTLESDPEWVEHDLGVDQVDRIRLIVRSFHQYGGALAEIEWE